ncbi:class I SAM-dependent methyltransferase [Brevundimonas sp.]|uniref:class I SAM-dependent methyltransferase n=1 Tax=Brevundimonas sp. TaxID=1871086 RepID=UPI002737CF97|nr:class I SAM-dependent methyltransferase [Brevundimonas sp.]MDP3802987.1 class I SAM-dependent methyltransferase [Brevundimonas sp.]
MSAVKAKLRELGYLLGISNSARADKCIAKDERENRGDFAFADKVLAAQSAASVKAPKQRYKLVDLERLLKQHLPLSILEIGSGGTTPVFAKYAKETGARVVSVDESEEWAGLTAQMVAALGYADIVEFVICPKRIDADKMEARYEGLPSEEFDFVLIDGPALEQDGTSYKLAVCTDIFDLPPPKVIAVDMRRPTVDAIWHRLGNVYKTQLSDILGREARVGLSYFSVFVRRD